MKKPLILEDLNIPRYYGKVGLLPVVGSLDDISFLKKGDDEGKNPIVDLVSDSHVDYLNMLEDEDREHLANIRSAVHMGLGVSIEDIKINFNNAYDMYNTKTPCTVLIFWSESYYKVIRKNVRNYTPIKKEDVQKGPKGMDDVKVWNELEEGGEDDTVLIIPEQEEKETDSKKDEKSEV